MPIKMVSNVPHVYAGKRLKAGDHFEARGESDARVLRALKRATDLPPPKPMPPPYVPPTRQHYVRKVLAAPVAPVESVAPVEPETSEAPPAKTTRKYQRRDLTATED